MSLHRGGLLDGSLSIRESAAKTHLVKAQISKLIVKSARAASLSSKSAFDEDNKARTESVSQIRNRNFPIAV